MKKLLIALLFALLAVPVHAQQDLSAADQAALVQKAEIYLNNITTLKSRFSLMGSDGMIETGMFYLQRPGRMRFQYDPPHADYIVADGLLIHYWDDGVKNYSNAPIGSTLADFLLKKKIRLSGELKVTSVRRPADNKLVITLVQAKNPEAGDLRLLFTENPQSGNLSLDKWRVTDATGNVTETTLTNVQTGTKLDPKLFIFSPPKGYDKDWKNR
jgi:outer membrane lipoprotein-sorting protein